MVEVGYVGGDVAWEGVFRGARRGGVGEEDDVIPDSLFSLGMMHRTKCGWVVYKFFINLFKLS